jgi:hypothetical protein
MATKDITNRQVCEAYQEFRILLDEYMNHPDFPYCEHDDRYPYDLLQEWTGQCFKVCYRAMERAARRGYIERGVSLRTGWITDKGKELLSTQ